MSSRKPWLCPCERCGAILGGVLRGTLRPNRAMPISVNRTVWVGCDPCRLRSACRLDPDCKAGREWTPARQEPLTLVR